MISEAHVALDQFRAEVERGLGLAFEESRLRELASVLSERLHERGEQVDTYLVALRSHGRREELRVLAERLTVGETFFFRGRDQFRAFADIAVPELRARSTGAVRVLSAGCASGEEPYTVAMIARDHGIDDLTITAFDLNRSALARADVGRYTKWSLREVPEDAQHHFQRRGSEWAVDPRLRSMVRFEERNLVDESASFWEAGVFDVIFCRNVLMYLGSASQRAIVARFAHALSPRGFLFLGHAETLRGISEAFDLCSTHDAFYYRLRSHDGCAPDAWRRETGPEAAIEPRVSGALADDGAWAEAIAQSSHRISELTLPPPEPTELPRPAPRAVAMDLFRRERYSEALEHLERSEDESDTDVLLLRAAVLVNSNEAGRAAETCRSILALDDLNAGAHYLAALCAEQLGDIAGAVGHDRAAIALDATFAMPHVHLGLLAKRTNDVLAMRHELSRALTLLGREDSARILLFGGGFSRNALIQICNAALGGKGETK